MNDNTSHPIQAALVKSAVDKSAKDLIAKGNAPMAVAFAMLNRAYALFRGAGCEPETVLYVIEHHLKDAEKLESAGNG